MGVPGGAGGESPPATAGGAGDTGYTPGAGRSPRRGDGSPLRCSCLENPMDRGARQDVAHGVAKSPI